MKTKSLVRAAHLAGPLPNGADRCYARVSEDGMCPGIKLAEWLNGLGDDDDEFARAGGRIITNGHVRINWVNGLAGGDHLAWADEKGIHLETCPTCNGTGKVVRP